MSTEANKAAAVAVIERGFNQGDLSVVDEYMGIDAVDHQEPLGTEFSAHLKDAITALRTAFPDLHFEIHHIVAEGDIVAFRSTMTGTHMGAFTLGPVRNYPPTGRTVSVPHMHFLKILNGKTYDLWHLWEVPVMMRQLGISPEAHPAPVS